MKNLEIIANAAVEAGVISAAEAAKSVAEGSELPLHTAGGWRERGMRIKTDAVPISIRIWLKRPSEEKYFLTKCYFYSFDQVEGVKNDEE